jgi:cytochrome c oxidase cbb3-type subunit 3
MSLLSKTRLALCLTAMLACVLTACERESRNFPKSSSMPETTVVMTHQHPGIGEQPLPPSALQNPYENRAYDVNEGKRLFSWYNCTGCHANGGGGIGPPLMDADWIYGSDPQNVYATILEGRPNGMPSFRGKIPENQMWEIVAYVRSLSGQLPKDIAPTRDDHMQMKWSESQKEKERPRTLEQPAQPKEKH